MKRLPRQKYTLEFKLEAVGLVKGGLRPAGPPGAKFGYWKTNVPGQPGWSRYDLNGNPITPEEAHPFPNPEPERPSVPPWTVWGVAVFFGTYPLPAY